MASKRKMKVFIWEGVFTDWPYGMAVAYAETVEQAIGILAERGEGYVAEDLGAPTRVIDCDKDTRPFVAYVYGGD